MDLATFYNASGEAPALGLSFDADWAPDFVLRDTVDWIRDRDLRATLFCTQPSPVLDEIRDDPRFEIAWHPNFMPGSSHGEDPDAVLSTLRAWFPAATGARSHSLVQSSPILRKLPEHGITYDCNVMLYDHSHLQVFSTFFGLDRVPYVWSDASHLLDGRPLEPGALPLRGPGLRVLDLHPMLVYLNARDASAYGRATALHRDLTRVEPSQLDPLVESGMGVRSLLEQLLQRIVDEGWHTYRLCDLVASFRALERTDSHAPFRF